MDRSPELDLLLLCTRWPWRDGEDGQLIRSAVSREPDWQLFLQLIHHHRVAPLVCRNLHASDIASPTPGCEFVLGELRRLSASSALQSLRCLAELRRVVQTLGTHNISVRVLKGLPLAQSVFGDLSLRLPGDIDLLIDEASILETDRVLRRFGYSGSIPVNHFSPTRLAFYSSHWKDIVYSNPDTGMEVDVHWRCFRNRAMPGAGVCATAEYSSVLFGGFQVETLPRLESLLYLCVHGTLDGWMYLKSLVDIGAQVREMTEPELDSLATLAAGYGILPELTATLILVRSYLTMDQWSARLLPASDPTVEHILRYADRVLVQGKFLALRESIPLTTTMAFELGLRRNLRYRFEPLLRVLFRPRMWETIPLPDFLFGIYPLLSPLEWAVYRLRRWWAKPSSGGSLAI